MSKGYIYVAANNVGGIKSTDYIKEAIFSAKSLRKHDPEAQITLFTNQDIKDDVFNEIKIGKKLNTNNQKLKFTLIYLFKIETLI